MIGTDDIERIYEETNTYTSLDQQSYQHSLLAMYDSHFMVCVANIRVCIFQNSQRLDGAGTDYW